MCRSRPSVRFFFDFWVIYDIFLILCTKSGKKNGLYRIALDECLDLSIHLIVKVLASENRIIFCNLFTQFLHLIGKDTITLNANRLRKI